MTTTCQVSDAAHILYNSEMYGVYTECGYAYTNTCVHVCTKEKKHILQYSRPTEIVN